MQNMRTLSGLVCFFSTVVFSFQIQSSNAETTYTSHGQLLSHQTCPVGPFSSLEADTCLVIPNKCNGGYCIYSDSDFSGSGGISFLTRPEMESTFGDWIYKRRWKLPCRNSAYLTFTVLVGSYTPDIRGHYREPAAQVTCPKPTRLTVSMAWRLCPNN